MDVSREDGGEGAFVPPDVGCPYQACSLAKDRNIARSSMGGVGNSDGIAEAALLAVFRRPANCCGASRGCRRRVCDIG